MLHRLISLLGIGILCGAFGPAPAVAWDYQGAAIGGWRLLEPRLRDDAGLEETCSKPATDLLLALNRLRQLSFRDPALLQEELTQVLHLAQPRPFLRKYFSLASLHTPDRNYR